MGSMGISDYSSLFQNYRIPNIPEVKIGQIETQAPTVQESPVVPQEKTVITEQEPFRNPAGKSADLENISLKFNTGEEYDYIGKDRDIEQLDMQKAISDMKKDSILQQYQYFVGSAQNLNNGMVSEDGIVIPKFDIF